MGKREAPFNNPFAALKVKSKAEPEKTPKPPPPRASAPPPKKASALSLEDSEAALFLEAVGEVQPVRRGPSGVVAPEPDKNRTAALVESEMEAATQLAELVTGQGPLERWDVDERLEGWAPGLDARILKRLRAGDYRVEAELDLHGQKKEPAREAVTRFILESRRQKKRCVLIVHGRGLHSEAGIPVLRELVFEWLSRGRLAPSILAFASAKPAQGGTGAVYVLLRR